MDTQRPDIYQQMVQVSEEKGWPEMFQTDLTKHDRKRLGSDDAPKVFGWVLGKFHTYLIDPRITQDCLQGYLEHLEVEGKNDLFFWFDGKNLRSVSLQEFSGVTKQFNRLMTDDFNIVVRKNERKYNRY